jgi:hypothetical protein
MNIKSREQIALELLAFKMETRLAEGYTTITVDDVNDVLYTGNHRVVDPIKKKELEVM